MTATAQIIPDTPITYTPTFADLVAALLRKNSDLCPLCLGTGEIDVLDPQTGWDTAPCPQCARPAVDDDELPF